MKVFKLLLFSGAIIFLFLLVIGVMNWRSEHKVKVDAATSTKLEKVSPNERGIRPKAISPIHEAFAVQENDEVILISTKNEPPAPIKEKIPPQPDSSLHWISGYWQWSTMDDDFVWVSGTWRRPPTGHRWISGHWKKNGDAVWVRLPGFWIKSSENELQYLPKMPPEPISDWPIMTGENTFWVKGHWECCSEGYVWVEGYEASIVPGFVYSSSRYVWSESGERNGYVFIEGFYDWSLEDRGFAYPSVTAVSRNQENIVYEPEHLRVQELLVNLFPYYPNYSMLFFLNYQQHPDFWTSRGDFPTWWAWCDWWAMSSKDTWKLFWWWTHPSYPMPEWLDNDIADKIVRATPLLINQMKVIDPPVNITPTGYVSNEKLHQAIEKEGKEKLPILPSDKKSLQKVYEAITPEEKTMKENPMGVKIRTFPLFGKKGLEWKIFSYLAPHSLKELSLICDNDSPEGALPWSAYRNVHPPQDPTPRQGAPVPNLKPEAPIQLQNKGNFMNNPMPQQNPSPPN